MELILYCKVCDQHPVVAHAEAAQSIGQTRELMAESSGLLV